MPSYTGAAEASYSEGQTCNSISHEQAKIETKETHTLTPYFQQNTGHNGQAIRPHPTNSMALILQYTAINAKQVRKGFPEEQTHVRVNSKHQPRTQAIYRVKNQNIKGISDAVSK